MHDPEKNAPTKIDIAKVQSTLSQKQMNKIKYECDLLRKSVQDMVYLAPFLFCEDVTAANTIVVKETKIAEPEQEEEFEVNPYAHYYYP
jgi:hypothetical protein